MNTSLGLLPNVCSPWNTITLPNDAAASSFLQSEFDLLIGRVVLPVVIGIAFLSNVAFIFMVWRLSRMHTITNYYLINVATADLLFACVVSPMYAYCTSTSILYGNVPFNIPESCFLMFGSGYVAWFASVMGITVVSFERFIAVCYPFQAYRMQSKYRAKFIMFGIWTSSLVFGLLTAPRYGKTIKECLIWPDNNDKSGDKYDGLPNILQTCVAMGSGKILAVFSETMEAASFFVALALNVYFYGRIILELSSRSIVGDDTVQQAAQTVHIRNQVARALVINGIVFFITQTPYRINNIDGLSKNISGIGFLDEEQSHSLKVFGRGLLFVNAAINSFIYAFSSKFYRDGFLEAFGCCRLTLKSKLLDTYGSHHKTSETPM